MIFSALTGGSLVRRSRAEHRRAVPPIDADAARRTADNGASAVSSRQAPRAAATLQRARTRPPSKGAFYRRRPSALALSLALITAGCGGHPVGPDYRPPSSALLSRAGSLPLHDVEHDTQAASSGAIASAQPPNNDNPVAQAAPSGAIASTQPPNNGNPVAQAAPSGAIASAQPPNNGNPVVQAAPSGAIASAQPLPVYWWRLYQDPRLDDLVRQALARNTDLRLAMANLERQQALLQEASSAQNPTLSANAEPYYGHPSGLSVLAPGTVPDNAWRYDGGLSLSYQWDLFGQIQRALEAASADSEAAQAALDLVKINVAANTARAYADLCATGLRLMTTRHSIELQQQSVDLTRRLLQAGRTGELDTVRARAQLQQLNATLPPLEARRQNSLYQLATLTGNLPQDFPRQVADCTTPPRLTQVIPVGDGAALLRRRPDIRQNERRLAAATARIGVAMADLYPKITLGLDGSSAGLLSGIGKKDTYGWSLGPLISWTLPASGAVQARIAQAQAGTRAELARFDGSVLTALQEVETALNNYARDLDRYRALEAARAATADVAQKTRLLYSSGKIGYLDVLDAERGLASSDAALAQSAGQLSDDQVMLFLALGGGWEAPTAVDAGGQLRTASASGHPTLR